MVGVAEHGSAVLLVAVGAGGEVLDRRRIELVEPGLSSHPHHHEGSWAVGRYLNTPGARALSLADAVALVTRVRASAERGAREGLAALAAALSVPIAGIAIRACPTLPPTIEERIADNRAQTVADSVMYREVLAAAAEARAGRCTGTIVTASSSMRQRRSTATTSTPSCLRWADRSGPPGKRSTGSPQLRPSQAPVPCDG